MTEKQRGRTEREDQLAKVIPLRPSALSVDKPTGDLSGLLQRAGTTFTELVATLPKRHPAVRLELTGPWPPYSFVGDEKPLPGAVEPVR